MTVKIAASGAPRDDNLLATSNGKTPTGLVPANTIIITITCRNPT